jgi:hypothetical protein
VKAAEKSGGKAELNEAYDLLEHEVPDRVARLLRWLRQPKVRAVRWTVGVLLIVLSFFSFLPIIGIEFLPIGLMLIAQDVPFLRKPVARVMIWLERKWVALRQWWRGETSASKRKHNMSSEVQARFATRRDAELAIEHLVQQHGIDRAAITVRASGKANSAGSEPSGADIESGHPGVEKDGAPKLRGDVEVRVDCSGDRAAAVKKVLAELRQDAENGPPA